MFPLFSSEQFKSGIAHDRGKGDAKRILFFQNLGLVGFVVRKIVGFGNPPDPLELSDLLQLGLIGLLDAVERFDASRGVQFQTYAVSRIRGTIQDELRKLDWVPRSVRKQEREQDAKIQKMEIREDQYETHEEIAVRLSMTMEEYRSMLDRATWNIPDKVVSLDEETETGKEDAVDEDDDPLEQLHKKQTRERVFTAIEGLESRERMVLILYYYEDLTFKEIARILHISESRAFQIHTTVMNNLRSVLKELA